jgi:acetoin utilization deacetylase AcuC-like enzyme
MTTAYINHAACAAHEVPPGHPERPGRVAAIAQAIEADGFAARLQHHEASAATAEQIGRVHPARYVELLERNRPASGLVALDPDTSLGPASLEAARRAAGAAVLATELVARGDVSNAFCAVRPPGHHAESERAMGFCLFNTIAVAAAHALTLDGIERVAILDFDVHHGNGTEQIFSGDERVLFCSTFQHPFYPGSGAGPTAANIVNTPLPAGTDGAALLAAIESVWRPALDRFEPDFILVSAGFDAHEEDPVGGFRVNDDGFRRITRFIAEAAEAHAGGRLVCALEGGYSLPALGRAVRAHVEELAAR